MAYVILTTKGWPERRHCVSAAFRPIHCVAGCEKCLQKKKKKHGENIKSNRLQQYRQRFSGFFVPFHHLWYPVERKDTESRTVTCFLNKTPTADSIITAPYTLFMLFFLFGVPLEMALGKLNDKEPTATGYCFA